MGCWFSKPVTPPPYDYYRNGPLRYLGYAGHIGSACRMLLPQSAALVPQMATTAYIMADIFNTTVNSSEKGEKQKRVIINAFDALIWHSLASVIIPGIVFNGIRSSAKQLFAKKPGGGPCGPRPSVFASAPLAARLIPCAFALLAAPIIIGPIDRGVDYIMNSTYRKWTLPTEDELKDPRILAKEEKLKAEKAAKEAKLKAEKAAKEAKLKAEKAAKEAKLAEENAKKAEKERLEKIKKAEKEAAEKARKKCQEEAKALREKLAAEDRELRERLKREENEFKERQAKLAEEQRKKLDASKMECD